MAGSEQGGRRHGRDDVARAALAILDEHGLPDLTMRRIAAALDVQPSALYWHFPNKQTLLAELADRILAGTAAGARITGAEAGIRDEAAALRDALLAYRDGAELVSSTLALGLGAGAARTRLAAAVVAGGYDVEVADRVAVAVLHFVLGQVLQEQQRLQYDGLGVVAPAVALSPAGARDDAAADFAFGIDLLVAGLAARHARI